MANTVSIALKAEGVSGVLSALKGVRQAFADAEAAATASVSKGTKSRLEGWQKELQEHDRIVKKLKEQSKYESIFGNGGGGMGAISNTRNRSNSGLGSSVGGGFGDLVKIGAVVGAMVAGIDMATSALKSFASFILSDVVKPNWALQTQAQQMSNASGGAISGQQFMDRARAVGIKNNFEAKDVAGAIDMFADKSKGMEMIDMVATMSKSRGIPMQELAGLVSPLSTKMTTAQMSELLPSLAAQSKVAKKAGGVGVSMGELASLGEGWIAPAEHLSGDDNAQLRQMGALMQTGRKGFKNMRGTASGITSFLTEATGSTALQSKFGKDFSVDKATGATQVADVARLIGDIMGATKGGTSGAGLKALGLGEGTAKLLGGAYGETYGAAAAAAKVSGATDEGAAKAGAAAVEEAIHAVVVASGTLAEEEAGRAKTMATTGQQVELAINQMKEGLLASTPEIDAFVQSLTDHAPEIADAALDLATALVTLVEGVASAAKWIKDTFVVHTEGAKVDTVRDKGDKTEFPEESETGTWHRRKGGKFLDYIKSDSNAEEAEKKRQFMGPSEMINGTLVYGEAGEGGSMRKRSPVAVPPPAYHGPFLPGQQPGSGGAPVAPAADAAHDSLSKVKMAADGLATTLGKLNITASQANRSQSLLTK